MDRYLDGVVSKYSEAEQVFLAGHAVLDGEFEDVEVKERVEVPSGFVAVPLQSWMNRPPIVAPPRVLNRRTTLCGAEVITGPVVDEAIIDFDRFDCGTLEGDPRELASWLKPYPRRRVPMTPVLPYLMVGLAAVTLAAGIILSGHSH